MSVAGFMSFHTDSCTVYSRFDVRGDNWRDPCAVLAEGIESEMYTVELKTIGADKSNWKIK